MDEGGGLEGVDRPFAPHVPVGQAAQLRVDLRHQAVEGALLAGIPSEQQLGDVPRPRITSYNVCYTKLLRPILLQLVLQALVLGDVARDLGVAKQLA